MFSWLFTHTPLLYLTQSLWRDEAFSVLVAEHGFLDIVKLTINDFTPPLYYFLLKIWMAFFGRSEIAVRLLSFVFYLGTVAMGYRLGKDVIKIKDRFFPFVVALFIAVNPMLVYYAFEARVYSMVSFFILGSLYFFLKDKWREYTIFSILAIYAHPYSILVLISQALYVFAFKRKDSKQFFKSAFIILLFYLPWLFVIVFQITRSAETWYYPVDFQLVKALLGSLYLGYEGTPPFLWKWCNYLSLVIIGFMSIGYWHNKIKDEYRLFLICLSFPILVVIGISFFKPIFTQRYLIYIALMEALLLTLGVWSIRSSQLRYAVSSIIIVCTLFFVFWYPPKHAKFDFQTPFHEINTQFEKGDVIINQSALTFFDAKYYAKDPENVYLLRKDTSALPPYIGSVLIPSDTWIYDIPNNRRVFYIFEDGSYEIIYPTS